MSLVNTIPCACLLTEIVNKFCCNFQTNQAVGSAVQSLEILTKAKFPPADGVMHGYLHFEAMSSHSYDFSCVCCGDHPPIVIMDLHKKGAFHQTGKKNILYSIKYFVHCHSHLCTCDYPMKCIAVSDLKSPPEDYKGEVNMEDFWDSVSNEHIARGFLTSNHDIYFIYITCYVLKTMHNKEEKVLHTYNFYLSGNQMNQYTVSPSLDCWAPWIGENTRRSAVVLNTEFQKINTSKAPGANAEWNVTEDHLLNELLNQEVCAVWILIVTSL